MNVKNETHRTPQQRFDLHRAKKKKIILLRLINIINPAHNCQIDSGVKKSCLGRGRGGSGRNFGSNHSLNNLVSISLGLFSFSYLATSALGGIKALRRRGGRAAAVGVVVVDGVGWDNSGLF